MRGRLGRGLIEQFVTLVDNQSDSLELYSENVCSLLLIPGKIKQYKKMKNNLTTDKKLFKNNSKSLALQNKLKYAYTN